ncbi:unnamed protein product [Blepharisma stoltei]|uniref:Uncharacterized protein n=1 Tax=Blepharisma stoltei TaxID=1481888 RepID=A0AAU9JEM3_9CILI|nr:unnamed protein product [Blepharisma stoltei]
MDNPSEKRLNEAERQLLEQSEAEKSLLTINNEKVSKLIDNLEQELKDKSQKITELEEYKLSLEKLFKLHDSLFDQKDKEISSIHNEIAVLNQSLAQCKEELKQKELEYGINSNTLNKKLNEYIVKTSGLETDLHFSKEENKTLEISLNEKIRAYKELEIGYETLLKNHQQEIKVLHSQVIESVELSPIKEKTILKCEKEIQCSEEFEEKAQEFVLPTVDDQSVYQLSCLNNEYKFKLSKAEEKAEILEEQLNELLEEIDRKSPIIAKQREDYENLVGAYNELVLKSKEALKSQVSLPVKEEKRIRELELQKDAFKKEKATLLNTIQQLLVENHRLQTGNVIEPTGSFASIPELINENSKLKIEKDDNTNIINSLREEIKEKNQIIEHKEKAANEVREENYYLKTRLDALLIEEKPTEDVSIESLFIEKKNENKLLRLRLNKTKSEHKFFEEHISFMKQKECHLNEEIEILKFKNNSSSNLASKLEKESKRQAIEILSLKEMNKKLQQQVEELSKEKIDILEAKKKIEQKQSKNSFGNAASLTSEKNSYLNNNERQLVSEYQKWKEDIMKLNSEIDKLDVYKFNPALEEVKAELNETKVKLQKMQEALSSELKIKEKLIKQIRGQRKIDMKAENAEMVASELNSSNIKIRELESRLKEIEIDKEKQSSETKKQRDDLENILNQTLKALEDEQARTKNLQTQFDEYKAQYEKLDEDKNDLLVKLEHYTNHFELQQKIRNEVRAKLIDPENKTRLQEECMNLSLEIDHLKKETDFEKSKLQNEIENMKHKENSDFDKIKNLEITLSSKEKDISHLKEELEDLRNKSPTKPEVLEHLIALLHKTNKNYQ